MRWRVGNREKEHMANSSFASLALWLTAYGSLAALVLWRIARPRYSLYGKMVSAICHKASMTSRL